MPKTQSSGAVKRRETPEDFAARVMAQRSDTARSARNRDAVAARVRVYEQRYEMKSHEVAGAITRGEIRETHEVCRWLFDYDLIKRKEGT